MTKAQLKRESFGFPTKGEENFKLDFFNKKSNYDERTNFLKRCMDIEDFSTGIYRRILNPELLKLWKRAKDLKEFKDLIKDSENTKYLQFTAELLDDDWYFLRSLLGDKKRTLFSDAGGVKVGNDSFNTIISDGGGDGKTRIAIFKKDDKFNSCAFKFHSIIKGDEINIYSYDCGDAIELTLEGSYSIYYRDGFVCFVENRT